MSKIKERQFLEFEKPIKDLYIQMDDLIRTSEKNPEADYKSKLLELEKLIVEERERITNQLTPWQRVQMSRHPERPYTLTYIRKMFGRCNCYGNWTTKGRKYEGPPDEKFWYGKSGRISQST